MKYNILPFAPLALFFSSLAQASPTTWVATLSMGPVWSTNNGESQTFFLASETEKTYDADATTNALAEGELFVGLQKTLHHRLLGQLGLAYGLTGDARLAGDVWDDADPQFNNLRYHYEVSHSQLALKGKLLVVWHDWFTPWISASVGVGFNKAHEFSNTATIFQAVPDSNFTSNTETAFTYSVGIGFQTKLDEHWQMGLGYEFADWGKSELGRSSGQSMNEGPAMNHLYTNGVLLNITFIM